jgi:hypothetical protein
MIFSCPECYNRCEVPDYFAGKQTLCPHCGNTIPVPKPWHGLVVLVLLAGIAGLVIWTFFILK